MGKKMMEIRNTCIQMYTNVNLSTFVSKYVPVVPNNSVNESKVL